MLDDMTGWKIARNKYHFQKRRSEKHRNANIGIYGEKKSKYKVTSACWQLYIECFVSRKFGKDVCLFRSALLQGLVKVC